MQTEQRIELAKIRRFRALWDRVARRAYVDGDERHSRRALRLCRALDTATDSWSGTVRWNTGWCDSMDHATCIGRARRREEASS